MRKHKAHDASKIRMRKAMFAQAGVTEIEVARALGVTKGYVSNVVNGSREGYAVKAVIAYRLGVSYSALWSSSCREPNERQAAKLRERCGLIWSGDGEQPFKKVEN